MKLNKFVHLYSKPLGNHTLNIMKKKTWKFTLKTWKNHGNTWNFVSPKSGNPVIILKCSFQIMEHVNAHGVIGDESALVAAAREGHRPHIEVCWQLELM